MGSEALSSVPSLRDRTLRSTGAKSGCTEEEPVVFLEATVLSSSPDLLNLILQHWTPRLECFILRFQR